MPGDRAPGTVIMRGWKWIRVCTQLKQASLRDTSLSGGIDSLAGNSWLNDAPWAAIPDAHDDR